MVSIIVPIYNCEKYLNECVESILDQSFKDIEVILVDDGSPDSSPAICEDFAANYPQIVKVTHQANGGLSRARNAGLRLASGEFIMFVDSDDTIPPRAVEFLHSAFQRYPECDISVGLYSHNKDFKFEESKFNLVKPVDAIRQTLYQKNPFHNSASAKLYRRALFDSNEPFAPGRYYEDLEFMPRIYSKAKTIAFSNTIVYYYRKNSASFINTWSSSRTDALWAVDSVVDFVARNCPDALPAAVSRRFSAYYNIFGLSIKYAPEITNRCWSEIKAMRRAVVRDRHVRLKNKLGACVAFMGKRTATVLAKLQYFR